MSRVVMIGLATAIVALSSNVYSQSAAQPSLGELARQTEATRAAAKKPAKVVTNADLKADPMAPPPVEKPAADGDKGFVSKTTGELVTAEELVDKSKEQLEIRQPKKPEARWRAEAEGLRRQLNEARALVASYETSPPAPSVALQKVQQTNRQRAQQMLASLEKSWDDFEASARLAEVPAAWLQPQ